MKKTVKIGVRNLVEHLFRTGDLRFDRFHQHRAIDGIRAHQHIQGQRGKDYQAEVSVVHHHETPDYVIEISGRIDGVIIEADAVVVEEIKSSSKDLDQLAASDNQMHWAQIKLYAYMYANRFGFSEIIGQLTYVAAENWQVREIRRNFKLEELALFFDRMLVRFFKWADHLYGWEKIRIKSIASLNFPYPNYRGGQRRMAVAVYRAIVGRQRFLVQAPTGIGKTLATIFPSLKVIGQEKVGKLFYLTARTTGRVAAEKVFKLLKVNGLRFKTITLSAKDKICFRPGDTCHPDECHYAEGYYNRVNDAIWAALSHDRLLPDRVAAIAREHSICPFEFSLDLSQWVDGIICDYNYAFDPRVFLRRFFADISEPHVLLVDEAHNLVDRSREMFSAQIAKQPLLELRRMVKGELKSLYKHLTKINTWFLALAKNAPSDNQQWSQSGLPSELLPLLAQFVHQAEAWLLLNLKRPFRELLLEHYFAVLGFLRVAEVYDESYAVCFSKEKKEVSIKLFCVDPSRQLSSALNRGAAVIFFSATLTPMEYFRSIFGLGAEATQLTLPSPFPPYNLGLFSADRMPTYYHQRKNSQEALCRLLLVFTQVRPGNFLIFFPSYSYMEMIHKQFIAAEPKAEVIVQEKDMSESQRHLFLAKFKAQNSRTLIGFAVLGGIFGEGIDLVGERLCGAAVVGVGLPGICLERELIRQYFEVKSEQGFEYAYQFPGINRVLQAAGRVIRSEKDRGVVLLVDSRYAEQRYKALLPPNWYATSVYSPEYLRMFLMGFWHGNQEKSPELFLGKDRKT